MTLENDYFTLESRYFDEDLDESFKKYFLEKILQGLTTKVNILNTGYVLGSKSEIMYNGDGTYEIVFYGVVSKKVILGGKITYKFAYEGIKKIEEGNYEWGEAAIQYINENFNVDNIRQNGFLVVKPCPLFNTINYGFTWAKTFEGQGYWDTIRNQLFISKL